MGGRYFDSRNVLVACLSQEDAIRHMAEEIGNITNGDLLYHISDRTGDLNDYEVVFIGCSAEDEAGCTNISAFVKRFALTGKTLVPFCTYVSSRRDEALQNIVDLTPEAKHLTGLGIRDVASSEVELQTWINLINEQWNELNADDSGRYADDGSAADPSVDGPAPMRGTVNLWYRGNVPTITQNAVNSDGPDFIPNMRVFTVSDNVIPKGAVIICPGGAFLFRGVRVEGYSVAEMLVSMGYQCFVVNYRISPYAMQESTADLGRAIRYVCAHASAYRIDAKCVALAGFSAGGLLCGEVLLHWQGLKNGTALDRTYRPDALDETPVSVCAIGMIYSFYGQMSLPMNDVETLRAASLPPAFYCWGSRDSLDELCRRNAEALCEAGHGVEIYVLEDYPHGYGTGGSADVWIERFDVFLTRIMSGN